MQDINICNFRFIKLFISELIAKLRSNIKFKWKKKKINNSKTVL